MLKKIKEFRKAVSDHPRLFVLGLVTVLIFVTLIIFRIADKYMNKNEIINEKFYTFVASEKIEFAADVTINRKGVISNIEPKININFTSSPIISGQRILFPKEAIIVFPEENYMLYKLYAYTYIEKESENLVTVKFNKNLDNYVIYDGKDTYFFSEDGILKVDDAEIKLSKYSVVSCTKDKVKYYDYEKDTFSSLDTGNSVLFQAQSYKVNLKNDTIGSDEVLLPTDTKYLELISEY